MASRTIEWVTESEGDGPRFRMQAELVRQSIERRAGEVREMFDTIGEPLLESGATQRGGAVVAVEIDAATGTVKVSAIGNFVTGTGSVRTVRVSA